MRTLLRIASASSAEPPPRVEARPPEPLTRKGIAVWVGLVALLLDGVYVGVSMFMADLGL